MVRAMANRAGSEGDVLQAAGGRPWIIGSIRVLPVRLLRRRDLIVLLGGAAIASPSVAGTQQKPMPVIGYLSIGAPAGRERYVSAFRAGLADRDYTDGKNVVVEFHWAGDDYARLPQLAPSSCAADRT